MEKRILALIPARMGSSRFPGKPMKNILGRPMIEHVYESVSQAKAVTMTAVATCDQEIYDYINSLGGKAIMTSRNHERASDRCAEALIKLEEETRGKFDIVVMVQGDEPMTHPEMLNEAIKPMLADKDIDVVNLVANISSEGEFNNKNCIKVVCDINNDALYFSREPIPYKGYFESGIARKQVCIIPFRRDFLIEYTNMSPTPLEESESVDMMRILEHGYKVRMVPTDYQTYAVDTIEDLKRVERIMATLI